MPDVDYGPRLSRPTAFNAKSRERFMRRRFRELVEHLGRAPSATERILIERIARLQWMLIRFDERIDEEGLGDLSGHGQRAYLAAENRLRLDLRDLGLEPKAPADPPWWEQVQAAREANQPKEEEPA